MERSAPRPRPTKEDSPFTHTPPGTKHERAKAAMLLNQKLMEPQPAGADTTERLNSDTELEPFPGAFTKPEKTFGDFAIEDQIRKAEEAEAVAAARARAEALAEVIPTTEDLGAIEEIAEVSDLPRERTYIGPAPAKPARPSREHPGANL